MADGFENKFRVIGMYCSFTPVFYKGKIYMIIQQDEDLISIEVLDLGKSLQFVTEEIGKLN